MYSKIIQDAISSFSDLTVLVVGDFMLDRFVYGSLERISPEAPIPILLDREQQAMPGGGGNVVANIVSLGARALPVTVIGDDEAGSQLTRMMGEIGVATDGMLVSPSRRTSRKSRFIAQKQQVLRFDEEDRLPLDESDRKRLTEQLSTAIPQADVVILSDYGKGILANSIAGDIISLCRRNNIATLVDPKGPDYEIYAGATAVTPNRKELAEASGEATATDDDVMRAARKLVTAHGFDFVLATRSEEGMSAIAADAAHHIPTMAQDVFDVSGAGDTVIASFALAHAAGLGLHQAAGVANAAAGAAVAKRGTARVTRDEVISRLAGARDVPGAIGLDDARRLVNIWKGDGLSVGFTNGCFDILHAGHISLLRQARVHCDRLIVGLNNDASVSRLKGSNRPINGERDRATVLAALNDVDAVVLFGEDTPGALISALLPDVLVKGADYALEEIVGADVVTGNGGTVIRAELEPDRSTSKTIRNIHALETDKETSA